MCNFLPFCPICDSPTLKFNVTSRIGQSLSLYRCINCDFIFNTYDPSASLAKGNLESTRLASTNFDIPSLETDFQNGKQQSIFYAETYNLESSNNLKVLDFGCSTGYFLSHIRDLGHIPYGIELNIHKRTFVNQTLNIPCYPNLNDLEPDLKFDFIFLFYSLEYVSNFKDVILQLKSRLASDAKLIIITPNLNDCLRLIWSSDAFKDFFFDPHSINYFSPMSLSRLMASLHISNFTIFTKQGYTIFNHVNWLLNNRPVPSKYVGADQIISFLISSQSSSDLYPLLNSQISELINGFNSCYAVLIESLGLGNQIHLTIKST